jgi:hypothetical protein
MFNEIIPKKRSLNSSNTKLDSFYPHRSSHFKLKFCQAQFETKKNELGSLDFNLNPQ